MTSWYYAADERQVGPFSREKILDLISAGVIENDTLAWHPGLLEWTHAAEIDDLRFAFTKGTSTRSLQGVAAPTAKAQVSISQEAAYGRAASGKRGTFRADFAASEQGRSKSVFIFICIVGLLVFVWARLHALDSQGPADMSANRTSLASRDTALPQSPAMSPTPFSTPRGVPVASRPPANIPVKPDVQTREPVSPANGLSDSAKPADRPGSQASSDLTSSTRSWTNTLTGRSVTFSDLWEVEADPERQRDYFTSVTVHAQSLNTMLIVSTVKAEVLDATDTWSYAKLVERMLPDLLVTSKWREITINGRSALRLEGKDRETPELRYQMTVMMEEGNGCHALLISTGGPNDMARTNALLPDLFATGC